SPGIRRGDFFSAVHRVEEYVKVFRELPAHDSAGIHRRMQVDIKLRGICHESGQRRDAGRIGAWNFGDPENVSDSAGHRDGASRIVQARVDYDGAIYADCSIMQMQSSKSYRRPQGETIVHIEYNGSRCDGAIGVPVDGDIHECSALGVDRYCRYFKSRAEDRAQNQVSGLQLSTHKSARVHCRVDIDVVVL